MPLFKSLRSKSSRKSSASVASETDNSTDFGPRSPSSTTYGSVKSSKGATDYRSNSKRSLNKLASSTSSPVAALPRYTSSSSIPGDAGNKGAPSYDANGGGKDASTMEAVSRVNPATPTGVDPSMANPRPSDLFAGKGVQWDAVKLAGSNTSPAAANKPANNDELQNFLKM